jgi:signal transduction histidine kinase
LAEAADMLSGQFRSHLRRFAEVVAPSAAALDRSFRAALRKQGYHPKQQAALAAITPGEAARVLASGAPAARFLEQVEYNGRRLAKFNVSPGVVTRALAKYDKQLAPKLEAGGGEQAANLRWVKDQLHFCVVLTLNNAFYQVREAETRAFYELFRAELESRNLDGLLRRFLDVLLRFCRADEAHLFLLDDAGARWMPRASVAGTAMLRPVAEAVNDLPARRESLFRSRCVGPKGMPALALDPAWPGRYASCWSVPLAADGRLAGVMQFAFARPYEWLPREQELLAGAAERCLLAAEKARLMEDLASREEQIRQLGEHMLHVEEVERQRISRELHDEAGQSLLCVRLQLEMLEQNHPQVPPELRAKLRHLREVTERTIVEIRRLIRALSPSVLEQFGLGSALRQLVSQFHQVHPGRLRLQMQHLGRLPKQTAIMVYRLVQECCNNIAKHSRATSVNIFLTSADGILRLEVHDNGVGFQIEEASAQQNSFGLSGMRERVALLGGKFKLESRPAGRTAKGQPGTRISIELPVSAGDAEENRARAVEA